MTEIGNFLKELRGDRSLREVGRKSGISHTYISNIERGIDPRSGSEIKPSPKLLRRLADYYDYPYPDLMLKTGYLTLADREDFNNLIHSK